MTLKAVATRFRAYQLDSAGSSFSYFSGHNFVLIEGRYSAANEQSIKHELSLCGLKQISALHITSWDQDHCSPSQLKKILDELKPNKVEYPGYEPHTDSGRESLQIISSYKRNNSKPQVIAVTPSYLESLEVAINYGYRDILYWPKKIDASNLNDNSTVKQFRSGSFNVLSLGDVESTQLSSYFRSMRSINSEVDVLIMAHHGADNGFTTSSFLKTVKPTLAVASSNFGNQFDHPKPEIRELLYRNEIKLFTTKNGDVIVESIGTHTGAFQVINLKAGSTEISSQYSGYARKGLYLKNNADTLRNRQGRHNKGPTH
jgi:competence protein ComEC